MDHRVTRQQKRMILQLMRESIGFEDKKEKEEHWEKCQNMLNKLGPPRKTLIQWKKIWRDMRCATKKKLLEIKRTRPGSPCPVVLNREDHEIIEIVGAGSDYFEESSESKFPNYFGNEHANEDNISLAELVNKSVGLKVENFKDALDEPTIEPIQQKKIKFILPAPPPPDDFINRKAFSLSGRVTNSFGMDDKVLSTLLESIATASKVQRQRRDLPDPDKLFLLSFVSVLKAIPEEHKFDVKTDILNVFRKWHKKFSYSHSIRHNQETLLCNTNISHSPSNLHHQSNHIHSNNLSNINQENGNISY